MSFNKLNSLFDGLQNVVNDCQNDVSKFVDGNNSAGTRVRKAMQAIKSLAQEVRIEGGNFRYSLFLYCYHKDNYHYNYIY